MIRRALLAALLALGAITTVTTAPAYARACPLGTSCVTTYYSDSLHTTVVGALYAGCDGAGSSWGTRTTYLDYQETPC